MDIKSIDKEFIASTYNRFPVEIVSGNKEILIDSDGKRYIDMGSGIGVNAFGINDEVWKKAVIEQLSLIQHTSNLYYTEPCAKLAKLLCEKTGMKKVFFGNSGAEANECLVKVARKWASENKGKEYTKIVTLKNSFHGRTLTTLALTGQDHYHELYQPLTSDILHVTAGDLIEAEEVFKNELVAAIIIEIIQGEGGVNVLDKAYIEGLNKLCKKYNVLFMVDEVQTGNGRTGKLYAYMNYDIEVDAFSTAKGLGGGLPIGACLLGEKVQNVFNFGDHGSTFGGNPIACSGAYSIISRMDDKFLNEVKEKGEFIKKELEGQEGIESVVGMGLMVGIKPTKATSGKIVSELVSKGVLALSAKDKVRLLPPLNISMNSLKKALDVIKETLKENA